MQEWQEVRKFGVPILLWWEHLVKPGIKKIALERTKVLNKERKSLLNLLMLRQSFLTKKLHSGVNVFEPLRIVHLKIENWFQKEVDKVKYQARVDDIQDSEKVRIYHHELHQKHIKKSSILKLKHENQIISGHGECMNFLHSKVAVLLGKKAQLDESAQNVLLNELEVQFTDADNQMLSALPSKEEVKESVRSANDNAAPGCDGISNLVYSRCFDILGDALTEVVQAVFSGEQPTRSQRTSLMVFSCPPKIQKVPKRSKKCRNGAKSNETEQKVMKRNKK